MQSSDAAAALAAMQSSRERLAALAGCPPQRHVAFALVLGGIVAVQSFTPPIAIAGEAVLLLAIGAIAAWDRKRTGMFINGYRAGKTQPLTFALLAVTLAIMAVSIWLKMDRGLVWAPAAGGAVVAVVAYVASAWWQELYRRELRNMP